MKQDEKNKINRFTGVPVSGDTIQEGKISC